VTRIRLVDGEGKRDRLGEGSRGFAFLVKYRGLELWSYITDCYPNLRAA